MGYLPERAVMLGVLIAEAMAQTAGALVVQKAAGAQDYRQPPGLQTSLFDRGGGPP